MQLLAKRHVTCVNIKPDFYLWAFKYESIVSFHIAMMVLYYHRHQK